jgi:hypothetical protein
MVAGVRLQPSRPDAAFGISPTRWLAVYGNLLSTGSSLVVHADCATR